MMVVRVKGQLRVLSLLELVDFSSLFKWKIESGKIRIDFHVLCARDLPVISPLNISEADSLLQVLLGPSSCPWTVHQ